MRASKHSGWVVLGIVLSMPSRAGAVGFENYRIMARSAIEVLPEPFKQEVLEQTVVAVLPIGDAAHATALAVTRDLAGSGLSAQTEVTGRSLKAGLKWAGKLEASVAVIIGESEIADGVAVVRNLIESEQERVAMEDIPAHIKGLISPGRGT